MNAVEIKRQRITVTNSSPQSIEFVLEPWCETYLLNPGESVEVIAEGAEPGCFEVVYEENRIIVYGWGVTNVQRLEGKP